MLGILIKVYSKKFTSCELFFYILHRSKLIVKF
jgi:hypothetical protein